MLLRWSSHNNIRQFPLCWSNHIVLNEAKLTTPYWQDHHDGPAQSAACEQTAISPISLACGQNALLTKAVIVNRADRRLLGMLQPIGVLRFWRTAGGVKDGEPWLAVLCIDEARHPCQTPFG